MKKRYETALFGALLRHAFAFCTSAAHKPAFTISNENDLVCSCHPEPAEKSVEAKPKRDFTPLLGVSGSYKQSKNTHNLQHKKSLFTLAPKNHPTCNCHPELVSGSYKRALKDNNGQLKKPAFTLAELLTAILIISVIMVALAPVITKRMKDTVSVTTDNKKGLEIYTNPGTYTFDVPIGISTLFIQGSGGGGGGAGANEAASKTVSYTSNTTWTVPTGVNKVTL